MSTLAIVQARMTSTRFPGKVLAPLVGQPMVLRQLERVRRATTLDGVIVATSTDPTDDELTGVVEASGVPVVRGSLDDVLDRFITAMDVFEPEVVVRLTADCPLISPFVIDQVVEAFRASNADYVSNTMTPTYPDGLDVEVVRASVLREVARSATDPPEREHVTLGVYRRHDRYRVENVIGSRDLSHLRWTVDTPADFAFVTRVYEALLPVTADFDLEDVLAYLEQHPEFSRTDADAARNAALTGLDTGAMNA
ncbi:MAG: glycosyltransferase family protein [Actinobacteria bacterium]|nr:glycosyltransferase family protein [Actinomycetota bacterium]